MIYVQMSERYTKELPREDEGAKIHGGHEVQLAPFCVTQCNQQTVSAICHLAIALDETHQNIFSSGA